MKTITPSTLSRTTVPSFASAVPTRHTDTFLKNVRVGSGKTAADNFKGNFDDGAVQCKVPNFCDESTEKLTRKGSVETRPTSKGVRRHG